MLSSVRHWLSSKGIDDERAGLLAVVLVSLVFVLIRLLMPFKFDGSYIDEYWHITSGISLIETGDFAYLYNDGRPYDRGALLSLWIGFWVSLFGKSILVAKLATVCIAIINYLFFLFLTTRLLVERKFQVLLLALYTLSPWLIFNHFYIRLYITIELFLLVLLVFGYLLHSALKDNHWKSVALYFSLIAIINILIPHVIRDQSEYMLLLASGVMLAFLFIYDFKPQGTTSNSIIAVIFGNALFSTNYSRAMVVAVVCVAGFFVLDVSSKLEFLLHGTIAYSSMPGHKYDWFFLQQNAIITLFFVVGVATFWWKSCGYERIFLPVAGALFLVHFASSKDLQIIRGILYFIPFYYLAAVLGLSRIFSWLKLNETIRWVLYLIIFSSFFYVTVTSVPKSFYWGPRIPIEISYNEYERVYDSVKENCQGRVIVEAAPLTPFIADFYGVTVDYVLSRESNHELSELFFYDENSGRYFTAWKSVPVLMELKDMTLLNSSLCLIVRKPSMKKYVPSSVEAVLPKAEKSWHYHNLDLYRFEKNQSW